MENDILSKVIEVEKSIQERLNEEKEKSLEWIEAVRQEAREEIAREEKKVKESCAVDAEKSYADAEKKAAEIIEEALRNAGKLEALPDDILTEIVRRHMVTILPSTESR